MSPIALALVAAMQSAPADPQPEIVVTANRRGGCRVVLEDRALSQRQLAANAVRWAAEGRPVRVVRPAGAGYACMSKIAFTLGRHGVRLIQFIERSERR
jgi:hypothetical protein